MAKVSLYVTYKETFAQTSSRWLAGIRSAIKADEVGGQTRVERGSHAAAHEEVTFAVGEDRAQSGGGRAGDPGAP